MAAIKREEILGKLNRKIESHEPLLITEAGVGIAAKCQAYAGADAVLVCHGARMRMAGFGSGAGFFAYKNSTDMLYQEAHDILPLLSDTPAIAGITAAEPFRDVAQVIDDMAHLGFSGVCNSPSTGWNDPMNAANLSKLGLGYDQEVAMIRLAHDKGLLTLAICYVAEQATQMAEAGADIVVAELGITRGGLVGVQTVYPFEEARERIQAISDAVKAVTPHGIVLCHGGILNAPDIVEKMLNSVTHVSGFLGGSATDRIPMEQGIIKTAQGFKQDRLFGFKG